MPIVLTPSTTAHLSKNAPLVFPRTQVLATVPNRNSRSMMFVQPKVMAVTRHTADGTTAKLERQGSALLPGDRNNSNRSSATSQTEPVELSAGLTLGALGFNCRFNASIQAMTSWLSVRTFPGWICLPSKWTNSSCPSQPNSFSLASYGARPGFTYGTTTRISQSPAMFAPGSFPPSCFTFMGPAHRANHGLKAVSEKDCETLRGERIYFLNH